MKRKIFFVVVAVIITVIAVTAIYIFYINKNYAYKITYKDEFVPGATYVFYINKDYNVKAIKKSYCTTTECIESGNTFKEEKYTVRISDENKETFKMFIMKLFAKEKNEIELSSLTINENFEQIMRVLKYNDESYFKYYRQIY